MAAPREERSMELRYQMTDILPLLPIPQPPHGRSAYNIPCPLCDRPGTREKHLNMLAIPGVTSLQHLEAALRDLIPLGVRHVMTCFDMDYLKNWHVENAYRNLVALLGKQDITFGTYLWVPDHNGLDDYIWEFCMNQGKAPE